MRTPWPLLALLGVTVLGCGELPGEVVGTYRITMKLTENTCGPASVNLLNGHRYAVELRDDGMYGYWRVPSQPALQGSYEDMSFRFENTGVVAHEESDAGARGCTLRQVDVLTGALRGAPSEDAGSDEDAETDDESADAGTDKDQDEVADAGVADELPLHGEHVFTISAVPGTDCSSALPPRGAFAALPCTVRYAITGVKIKAF